ncbi:MAG: LptF/LptG family permease [Alphaproteobacteria bacterium]|nr:LptF/LptG family permease [Alphaproteobacteria bacterium]
MFKKVDFYILRQVMTPLLMTVGLSAMLLLLEKMLRLFDLVANQGGPVGVVFRMLGNLIPQYIGLALPLGFLLGVLLAFRKLASSSELEALQSSGMSLLRLMRGPICLSFVLMVINLALLGYIQPRSFYTYQSLMFDLTSGAFGTSIKPGEYNDLGNGFTLRIEKAYDGGQRLEGIFAQKERPGGKVTTITAREGSFLATPDGRTVLMRLRDGVIVDVDPKKPAPRVFSFKQHDYPFEMPQIEEFRARGDKERELTLPELWSEAHTSTKAKQVRVYTSAFIDRLLRSLTILVLPFMAVGLGVGPKRQQKQLGLVVGVILLLTLHKMLEFGTAAAGLGDGSSLLNLGLPFVAFNALAGFFFYTTAYRIGARPLGWIENGWEAIVNTVQKVSFFRPSDEQAGEGAA